MLDMVITQESFDTLAEPIKLEYKPREGSDGGFQLDVQGTYSTADRDALQRSLAAERVEHKTTKQKYVGLDGVTRDQVEKIWHTAAERGVQLETAGSKPEEIEAAAVRLTDARIATQVRPLERRVEELTEANGTLTTERDGLSGQITQGVISSQVMKDFTAKAIGGITDARPDVELWARGVFEVNADENVVSRDVPGVTPGLSPKEVFADMHQRDERPHWFGRSKGGGSRPGSNISAADNIFKLTDGKVENLTKCGQLIRSDPAVARRMCEAAGAKGLFPSLFRG